MAMSNQTVIDDFSSPNIQLNNVDNKQPAQHHLPRLIGKFNLKGPSPSTAHLEAENSHIPVNDQSNSCFLADYDPASHLIMPAASDKGAHYTLIANVPYDTVRQDLVLEFRKFGRVELAMVVCDEASRHPHKEWTSTAGYAFVRFSKRSEAAAAIQAASMGLITIRGTRVRADWARKDSYAKRGRVSPSQGAPLIGPMGVPDGIELLQNSLLQQHWRRQQELAEATTPSTVDSPSQYIEYAAGNCTPLEASSPLESDSGISSDVLQVLKDAFTDAFTINPLEATQSTNALRLPARFNQERSVTVSSAITPADVYAQLVELIKLDGLDTPTGSNSDASNLLPRFPETPIGFQDALSPCSRGLLAEALHDVVCSSKYCDGSPSDGRHHHLQTESPEELLRRAVGMAAAAGSPSSCTTGNGWMKEAVSDEGRVESRAVAKQSAAQGNSTCCTGSGVSSSSSDDCSSVAF